MNDSVDPSSGPTPDSTSADTAGLIQRCLGSDLGGKRVLDIGCGHGDLALLLARSGGNVSGVDLDSRCIELAIRRSRQDNLAVDFQTLDATAISVRNAFKKGAFDLILLNEVLEFVHDVMGLIDNVAWLLSQNGLVYVRSRNGFSPGFILSAAGPEQFGISLLGPDKWSHFDSGQPCVFFRSFELYSAVFAHCGLSQRLLIDRENVLDRDAQELKDQLKLIFAKAREFKHPNVSAREFIRQAIVGYRDRFFYDLQAEASAFVQYKYGSAFHEGFFGRSPSSMKTALKAIRVKTLGSVAKIANRSGDAKPPANGGAGQDAGKPPGFTIVAPQLRAQLDALRKTTRFASVKAHGHAIQKMARLMHTLGEDGEIALLVKSLIKLPASQLPPGRDVARVASYLRFSSGWDYETLVQELFGILPEEPTIASLYADELAREPAQVETALALLEEVIARTPAAIFPARILMLLLVKEQMWDRAEVLSGRVARHDRTGPARLRAATALLRRGKESRALAYLRALGPRFRPEDFGALSEPLRVVSDILNRNYFHAQKTDLDLLGQVVQASLEALRDFVEQAPAMEARDLLMPASALWRIEIYPFQVIANLVDSYSHRWSEEFGTLDIYAFKALHRALLEHVAVLTEMALTEPVLERGGDRPEFIREICTLHAAALNALGRPDEAKPRLERVVELGFDGPYFRRLVESCALTDGTVEGSVGDVDGDGAPVQVHRMAEFDEWARLEGLHPRNLLAEVGVPGPFEMMRSDGMLRQCRYALPESKLAVLDDVALDVRGSELCIGPKGTLLKPHQWHYRLFPPRSPLVINRGTRAVSLRRASHVRVISQPTLVLANNDCYKTPNYFHWTLLILSRIHWSLRHGLLDQRLLAMPSEIRPYMRESLALIGVSEQMMLQYDHTDDLRFSNAALLSPIEFASETLSLELREAMWKAVGASAEEGGKDDGAFLFLVRKDQPRRMIFDFEKVCDLAESLGFTLLAPEDYSVADQVRIFSRAKGIAGPAGAAFTNILYCQPGTKILALTKEEVAAPTFIDLSLALGLRYRWCLGQSEPHSLAYVDILGGAYRIDLQVLEKNLRWMIDDAA